MVSFILQQKSKISLSSSSYVEYKLNKFSNLEKYNEVVKIFHYREMRFGYQFTETFLYAK